MNEKGSNQDNHRSKYNEKFSNSERHQKGWFYGKNILFDNHGGKYN